MSLVDRISLTSLKLTLLYTKTSLIDADDYAKNLNRMHSLINQEEFDDSKGDSDIEELLKQVRSPQNSSFVTKDLKQ